MSGIHTNTRQPVVPCACACVCVAVGSGSKLSISSSIPFPPHEWAWLGRQVHPPLPACPHPYTSTFFQLPHTYFAASISFSLHASHIHMSSPSPSPSIHLIYTSLLPSIHLPLITFTPIFLSFLLYLSICQIYISIYLTKPFFFCHLHHLPRYPYHITLTGPPTLK